MAAVGKIGAATGGPVGGVGGGPRLFYDFTPACQGNGAADGDAMCGSALAACRRADASGLLYFVFRGVDPAALANVGTVCLGDGDFVDRQRLDRDVAAELVRRLELVAPVVGSAPAAVSLVGVPTVLWAGEPATGRPGPASRAVSATVDDVAVTLRVTGRWVWQLGDGTGPHTLTGPGVAYQPGVSPDPRVDPAYYTSHHGRPDSGLLATYRQQGSYPITVTVTWTPSYTVDYQIGATTLDQATVSYTTTRTLRVGEARAVLVTGSG